MRVSPRSGGVARPGHSRTTARWPGASRSRDASRPSHCASSGASCSRLGPTSSSVSARNRASFGVVSIIPASHSTARSRSSTSAFMWSTTAPIRSARPIAARAPAMSVPRPVTSGRRLAASNPAASASARSSAAGLPPIHALAMTNSRQ
jgi:hypothetical protein